MSAVDEAFKDLQVFPITVYAGHYKQHRDAIEIILAVRRKMGKRYWENLTKDGYERHCQVCRFPPIDMYPHSNDMLCCAGDLGWSPQT